MKGRLRNVIIKLWILFIPLFIILRFPYRRSIETSIRTERDLKWKPTISVCPSGYKEDTEDLLCRKPIDFDPQFKNPCWYDKKKELKCLPYFMLIGMQKCGSTDIYDSLVNHPDFVKPVTISKAINTYKEMHYFDVNMFENPSSPRYTTFKEYIDFFSPIAEKLEKNKSASFITGEGTPDYFYLFIKWKQIPQNKDRTRPLFLQPSLIKKVLPNVKLIVSLREPAERARSNFFHYASREKKNFDIKTGIQDFHTNITEGLRILNNCLNLLGDEYCATNGRMRIKCDKIIPSMYSVFMREWLKEFPRDQIHIVNFSSYKKNKAATLNKVFKFLNIRELSEKEMTERKMLKNWISNEGTKVDDEETNKTMQLLRDFYKPYNNNLKRLLEDYSNQILDWY